MFAVYADKFSTEDPLSALVVGERPDPVAPDGWTTVTVKAASLNHHDLWSLRGVGLKEAALPGKNTVGVCHDIRTYYEETAVELVNGPIGSGRAVENWFFDETEAGKVVLAARAALSEQDVPFPFWFYMAPGHR